VPGLYYELEACPLIKSQIRSLHGAHINNAFRKILLLNSCDLAFEYVVSFNCSVSDAMYIGGK